MHLAGRTKIRREAELHAEDRRADCGRQESSSAEQISVRIISADVSQEVL